MPKRKGFRDCVEQTLVDVGYLRVLSWLISTYVPTLAEEIKLKFEHLRWPTITVESMEPQEELFAITHRDWFTEFSALYSSRNVVFPASAQVRYGTIATRLEIMLQNISSTRLNYLTPEVDVSQTRLRILVCETEAITLIFDIPMTPSFAYRRFNQRLNLFVSDLKDFVAPTNTLVKIYHAHLATMLSVSDGGGIDSRGPHYYLQPFLISSKPFIEKRDSCLFCAFDTDQAEPGQQGRQVQNFQLWKEWLVVDALWKFASPQTKEAVWRALEDLLDLSALIQQVLLRSP